MVRSRPCIAWLALALFLVLSASLCASLLFFLSGHRGRHVICRSRARAAWKVHLGLAGSAVRRVPQALQEAPLSRDTCSISHLTPIGGGERRQIQWQVMARLTSRGHVKSDVHDPHDRS